MSQNNNIRPRLGYQDRIDLLERTYGALSQTEIALKAGVSRKTIVRDIANWKNSGRYDDWLDEQWHDLLEDPDIQKKLKFIALTRIKLRRMTEKFEAHITGTQEVTVSEKKSNLVEVLNRVPESQRSTLLNGLRALWRSTQHPGQGPAT